MCAYVDMYWRRKDAENVSIIMCDVEDDMVTDTGHWAIKEKRTLC